MKYEYKSDCVGLGQIIQKVKKVTKTKIKEKIQKLIDFNSVVGIDKLTPEAGRYITGYLQALRDVLDVIDDE